MTREAFDPVAQLKTVSLKALQERSADEVAKLLAAAKEDGVFYLDVANDGQLKCVNNYISQLSRSLFGMDEAEKLKFDVDKLGPYKLNGYKPVGRNVGGIKGQRDGFESYGISSDHPAPPVIAQSRHHLDKLRSICLDLAQAIFETLSMACQLPEASSFQSCHSTSPLNLVRLLRYPRAMGSQTFSIPQTAHTDMGSLTFLFTDSPGLQIQPAGSSEWLHVLPKAGYPIVNFGDAMKILSNDEFHSVLHRVVSVPGGRAEDRYSFAYLMRPEPLTLMAPLPGMGHADKKSYNIPGLGHADDRNFNGEPVPTCEEWVTMKFRKLRA